MQKLQETFRNGGFDLRQLKREDDVILLEKTKMAILPSYEVAIIQIQPADTFPSGKSYPEREVMPSNEDWGALAWSFSDKETAEQSFAKVVGYQKNPDSKV